MFHGKRKILTVATFLALFGGTAFLGSPSFVGAQNGAPQQAQPVSISSPSVGWAERLKALGEDTWELHYSFHLLGVLNLRTNTITSAQGWHGEQP